MFSHGRADLISLLSRLARDSVRLSFSSHRDESADSIIAGNRIGKKSRRKVTIFWIIFVASLYFFFLFHGIKIITKSNDYSDKRDHNRFL